MKRPLSTSQGRCRDNGRAHIRTKISIAWDYSGTGVSASGSSRVSPKLVSLRDEQGAPPCSQLPGHRYKRPPQTQPIKTFSPAASGTGLTSLAGLVLFTCALFQSTQTSLRSSWKHQENGLHHPRCSEASPPEDRQLEMTGGGGGAFRRAQCQGSHVSGTWWYLSETQQHK